MHYLIKQEKCDSCQSPEAMTRPPSLLPADNLEVFRCKCRGSGYIETRVSADEWLESKLSALGLVTTEILPFPTAPTVPIDEIRQPVQMVSAESLKGTYPEEA